VLFAQSSVHSLIPHHRRFQRRFSAAFCRYSGARFSVRPETVRCYFERAPQKCSNSADPPYNHSNGECALRRFLKTIATYAPPPPPSRLKPAGDVPSLMSPQSPCCVVMLRVAICFMIRGIFDLSTNLVSRAFQYGFNRFRGIACITIGSFFTMKMALYRWYSSG